jgi:hypothetical protein
MKLTANCIYCNHSFSYDNTSSNGKFCSNQCSGKHKLQETAVRIEQGLVTQNSTLKKYLTNKRGYNCECCGVSEWNGKELSLHVDHVDGNSDNNFPDNLRLLCPNCHSQTETFSGRNKKNSKRSSYMHRYRAKKKIEMVADERIELPTHSV